MSPHITRHTHTPTFLLVGSALLALGGLAWRLLGARSPKPQASLPDPLHSGAQKDITNLSDIKTGQNLAANLSFANKTSDRPYYD